MATRIDVNRQLRQIVMKTLRRFPDEAQYLVRSAQIVRRNADPADKEAVRAAMQEMYRAATRGGDPLQHAFAHWVADVMNDSEVHDGETDPSRDEAFFEGEAGIEP